jgi:hypothetical protein
MPIMEKKDIYEHLAEIYLDASLTKKKPRARAFKNAAGWILAGAFLLGGVIVAVFLPPHLKPPVSENALLISSNNPVRIAYNLSAGSKESSTLYLNGVNLRSYKSLVLNARSDAPAASMPAIAVEILNKTGEKGLVYIRDAGRKWREYEIPFSDFKPGLSDWSRVESLTFIVEEWNAPIKKGVVYIDNIRFLR